MRTAQMSFRFPEPKKKKRRSFWLLFILIIVSVFVVGLFLGWMADKPGRAEARAMAAHPCGNSPNAIEARNRAWQAMNSMEINDSEESKTATIIMALLKPGYTAEIRAEGLALLVNQPMTKMNKDHEGWWKTIQNSTEPQAELVESLYKSYNQSSQLGVCLLRDKKRIKMMIEGQKIPLEK